MSENALTPGMKDKQRSEAADARAHRLLDGVDALLQLFTVNEQRFPSAEGRMRYNPLDFQTLRYLCAHPGAKAADVARALGVSPTTQQSVMDRLVKIELVRKADHPDSGRAKAHVLTRAGQDMMASIIRQDLSNMNAMLAGLEPDEQDVFVVLVEKVVRHLETLD